jgi:hypothetical protein
MKMEKIVLVLLILAAAAATVAYAEDAQLGKDDFFSQSVASVFDKLNKYATGEKQIISEDAKGINDNESYAWQSRDMDDAGNMRSTSW